MGELLPCPFCGAKPCEDIQNGYIQKADGSFYQHVWCDTCNASGGEFKTAEEAIERWNAHPRTEGRGEGEPVAWRVKDFADGWILFHTEAEARREAEGAGNLVQPLYASPIHEPEMSRSKREEIEKLLRENLPATCGLHCQKEQTQEEEDAAYRDTAHAILNLAPVAKGASQDAELSDEFDRPGRLSDATRHSAEGAADPALSGTRGVVTPVGGRGDV